MASRLRKTWLAVCCKSIKGSPSSSVPISCTLCSPVWDSKRLACCTRPPPGGMPLNCGTDAEKGMPGTAAVPLLSPGPACCWRSDTLCCWSSSGRSGADAFPVLQPLSWSELCSPGKEGCTYYIHWRILGCHSQPRHSGASWYGRRIFPPAKFLGGDCRDAFLGEWLGDC